MKWEPSYEKGTTNYMDGDVIMGYVMKMGKGRFTASAKGAKYAKTFETREKAMRYVEDAVKEMLSP